VNAEVPCPVPTGDARSMQHLDSPSRENFHDRHGSVATPGGAEGGKGQRNRPRGPYLGPRAYLPEAPPLHPLLAMSPAARCPSDQQPALPQGPPSQTAAALFRPFNTKEQSPLPQRHSPAQPAAMSMSPGSLPPAWGPREPLDAGNCPHQPFLIFLKQYEPVFSHMRAFMSEELLQSLRRAAQA